MTQPPYPGPSWQPGPYAAPPWHQPLLPGLPPLASPARGYAIAAAAAAVVLTLLEWGEAIAAWPAGRDFADAVAAGDSVENVLTAYDIAALPLMLAMLVAYVGTCLWLYQARVNAENLAPTTPHVRGRAWAWGGWIVPVVNLWFPFQVVRDTWRASTADRPTGLLGWWWASWLVYLVTWGLGGELEYALGVDALRWFGAIETVHALLATVALALWLAVLRGLTRAQGDVVGRMVALRARQWDAYHRGLPIPVHADGAPAPRPAPAPPTW